MGKQIQTLIDKRRIELLEHLLDKGYGIIANVDDEVVKVEKKEDISEELLRMWQIYVGDLKFVQKIEKVNRGTFSRISNKDVGRLIELGFSNVYENEKRIIQGRIYFENGFSTPITKEEAEIGSAIYKEVVKWVKKNIPYRLIKDNIRGNIVEYKMYVEDYLYELITYHGYIYR